MHLTSDFRDYPLLLPFTNMSTMSTSSSTATSLQTTTQNIPLHQPSNLSPMPPPTTQSLHSHPQPKKKPDHDYLTAIRGATGPRNPSIRHLMGSRIVDEVQSLEAALGNPGPPKSQYNSMIGSRSLDGTFVNEFNSNPVSVTAFVGGSSDNSDTTVPRSLKATKARVGNLVNSNTYALMPQALNSRMQVY